ncbi:MAG: TetR/AcrR family transcriptional regulator [Flavobacteriales bacterium]|nr:TetR/AcrR family transcriptional regulator [Flavobacteriales bacterium]MBK9597868.1 TetR/AcrR family transcriptional regulator [Flavobacteriales bacterium]
MSSTTNTSSDPRTAILSAAKDLFWKHGIRRVTVEEISKEAGISKMTFYRTFSNKQEVAAAVLTDVLDSSMQRYRAAMDSDAPFEERIREVVLLKHDNAQVMSDEFLKDVLGDPNSELAIMAHSFQEEHTKIFLADLRKAQRNGWIRKEIKPAFILFMLERMNAHMFDVAFRGMYKNSHDAIMELTNFMFYGLFPMDAHKK